MESIGFLFAMEIKTERLMLRKYSIGDKSDFIDLFTDRRVMKRVDEGPLPKTNAEGLWKKVLADNFKLKHHTWAVFGIEDGRNIGHALINKRLGNKEEWELGYILKEQEWRKGFATEIAKALITFSFENLNLNEVYATVDDDHFMSINVLKKAGMKFIRFEFDDQGRFSVYGIRKS